MMILVNMQIWNVLLIWKHFKWVVWWQTFQMFWKIVKCYFRQNSKWRGGLNFDHLNVISTGQVFSFKWVSSWKEHHHMPDQTTCRFKDKQYTAFFPLTNTICFKYQNDLLFHAKETVHFLKISFTINLN